MNWSEVAELTGVKLDRHPQLEALADRAREIKFQRLMQALIDRGWPNADTCNLSAWWEDGASQGVHAFICDDLGFRLHGEDGSFFEAQTVDEAVASLEKMRGDRELFAALRKQS